MTNWSNCHIENVSPKTAEYALFLSMCKTHQNWAYAGLYSKNQHISKDRNLQHIFPDCSRIKLGVNNKDNEELPKCLEIKS